MSKPIVQVFAGLNGSGKSTLFSSPLIPRCGVYINSDNIEKDYSLTSIEASNQADLLKNKCVEKKINFTFETVFSNDRHLVFLQNAKEKGYEVRCYYILTTNPDINVARVRSRVLKGGHNVPEETILTAICTFC